MSTERGVPWRLRRISIATLAVGLTLVSAASASLSAADRDAQAGAATRPKRVLLIGQGPDNHPWGTHEYLSGMRILARCLNEVEGLQTIVVSADGDWKNGPELLDGADAAVLFVSHGANWLVTNPARLEAFRRLAARKGGLVVLHWGMGTREAADVAPFVSLFGACHGGPDRKYKVLTDAKVKVADRRHPIVQGLDDFAIDEEFYYALKRVQPADGLVPLLEAEIDGASHMVAWGWTRPDGGRSAGYTGLHFHRHWDQPRSRRLLTQAVLWTLDVPVPPGLTYPLSKDDLDLPRPKP